MTEILTESFCERCGTRYTFESAAPRKSRLGRVRVLGKGMRNFVLSDDASFSEALADARSEEEIAATAHQLDAFHQTFNFCLTCRQYTCGDCWNPEEGRCLTCSPLPVTEEAPSATSPLAADLVAAAEGNGHAPADEAWPDADLSDARLARALGLVEPDDETAAPAAPHPSGIAPGQSIEEAVAEYEARLAADEAALADSIPVPTEPVGAEVGTGLVAAEPVAAEAEAIIVEPEPEPVAAEAEAIIVEPEPEPVAAEAEPVAADGQLEDVVEQPTWPGAPQAPAEQPLPPPAAMPGAPAPWLTVAPEETDREPQWPVAPSWPVTTGRRDVPTTLAGRPLLPQADPSGLWAASAREVLTGVQSPAPFPTPVAPAPTAQPCLNCGLSLSANARFCRRCGTRQG